MMRTLKAAVQIVWLLALIALGLAAAAVGVWGLYALTYLQEAAR